MKKSLLIMLVFGISLFISSMAIASGGSSPDCDGVESDESREVCNSYCADLECATEGTDANPKACARLKANYIKQTGEVAVPCDIVACATCGDQDPDDQLATIGECEQMKAVDCAEPYVVAGEVPCDIVTIPAELINYPDGMGCDNISQNTFMGPMFPDCQNGMPGWVCGMFLGGTALTESPEGCPAPPSCFE